MGSMASCAAGAPAVTSPRLKCNPNDVLCPHLRIPGGYLDVLRGGVFNLVGVN